MHSSRRLPLPRIQPALFAIFLLALLCATAPARAASPPVPVRSIEAIDGGGTTGVSLVISATGLPLIAYHDPDDGKLWLAVCTDLACTNPTLTAVAWSTGYADLALTGAGLPVLSYTDGSTLMLTICHDLACQEQTQRAVDSATVRFGPTSLALAAGDRPVISYYDPGGEELRLAVCDTATCSAPAVTTLAGSLAGSGRFHSLALAGGDRPVVAYYEEDGNDLRLAVCNDAPCSQPALHTVDAGGDAGAYASLALASSGNPVISYYDATGDNLKLAVCQDLACAVRALYTVDAIGDVGRYSSLALTRADLPVIAYVDSSNNALKLATCDDSGCSNPVLAVLDDPDGGLALSSALALAPGRVPTVGYFVGGTLNLAVCHICTIRPLRQVVEDTANSTGLHASLALDTFDDPAITHYDESEGDLRLAVCARPTCQQVTRKALVTTGTVGRYSSLAVRGNGRLVASYFDDTNNDLEVASCYDGSCGVPPTINTVAGLLNIDAGRFTSLLLRNNNPVISYYNDTTNALHLAFCDDTLCGPPNPGVMVDDAADVGTYNDLALNASGYAVVSYYDSSNGNLKLAVCNDAACTNPTVRTVDGSLNNAGSHTSLALNGDGHPVIAYLDASAAVLKLAVCPDATCTTPTITTVDSRVLSGQYTSLALNSAGLPIISYADYGYWTTRIAFCTDVTCTNPVILTVDGADGTDVGDYTSLALDDAGYPAVAYHDRSNQRLKAVFFDYLSAPDDLHLLQMGADTLLDWGGGGGLYDVWRAPSPYFDPCSAEGTVIGERVLAPHDVSAYVADGSADDYFLVTNRDYHCDLSNRTGIFHFELVAGTP